MKRGILSIFSIFTPVFLFAAALTILIWAEQVKSADENPPTELKATVEAVVNAAAEAAMKAVEQAASEENGGKKDDTDIFVRLIKDDTGTDSALETSIVPYASKDGTLEVSLIGAIHLGEGTYYDELNTAFKDYDIVLYEVVAEEGTRPGGGNEQGGSVIGLVQFSMARALGLEFQLHHIDYSPENLLHADMTPQEFADAMKARQESFLTMYMRTVGYAMGSQNLKQNPVETAASVNQWRELIFGQNKSLALKRMMAAEMGNLSQSIAPLEGKEGSAILTDRNAKVVRILREQIDAGKKKIAIFYGAAHLPDFARQLENEFELKRGEIRWLKAWDLAE